MKPVPERCTACGRTLELKNLFVDDGCPCNSPRGVNFEPRACALCGTDNCVKPGHHVLQIWGWSPASEPIVEDPGDGRGEVRGI